MSQHAAEITELLLGYTALCGVAVTLMLVLCTWIACEWRGDPTPLRTAVKITSERMSRVPTWLIVGFSVLFSILFVVTAWGWQKPLLALGAMTAALLILTVGVRTIRNRIGR